jgi:hypothetical protein
MTKLFYILGTFLLLNLSFTAYSASPVITISGNTDTTINIYRTYQDEGSTAIDAEDGNITSSILISGNLDTSTIGDYVLQYTVTDSDGNSDTATRIIKVRDIENPIIKLNSAEKTNSCWIVVVQLQHIFVDITTATDNYNSLGNGLTLVANPSNSQGGADVDTRFQGTTSVTYTATDSSGNVTTQCINYIVRDFQSSFGFFTRELDIITHRVNTPWISTSTMRFIDSIDGDITSSILIDSKVDIHTLGEYDVNYTVTNSRGKTFTKTIVVQVVDDINPIISGKNGSAVKIAINSIFNPANYLLLYDNYYDSVDLSDSLFILYNDLDITTLGLYSTVFILTDKSGNISNEFTLIIEVVASLSTSKLAASNPINIYPNPTSDNITIQMMSGEVIDEITLHTLHGDELKHVTVYNSKTVLNLSPYTTGIYLLTIFSKGQLFTRRVTLE